MNKLIFLILTLPFMIHGKNTLIEDSPANNLACPECKKTIDAKPVAETIYRICREEMPTNLETFLTADCKKFGYKMGKSCLLFDEMVFEEKLKKGNPAEYTRYVAAKEVNDKGNSQACIRYSNGVLKRPRTIFLNRTTELSEFIISTAKYYEIPPETIPCAIGGDATTTHALYPDHAKYENNMIQRAPLKRAEDALKSKGLKIETAPIAPKNASADEVTSIREAALIIRHGQEVYKEAGFKNEDLRSEILVSIYHLGAFRDTPPVNTAIKRMSEGSKPGMSFIGFFCYLHLETFKKSLGL